MKSPDNIDNDWDWCPSSSPFVWTDGLKEGERTILKTRCKRWDCPYCQQINKLQHRLRIYHGCVKLQDSGYCLDFVTFTSNRYVRSTEASYRVFQQAWTKLSTRFRRKMADITELPPVYVYIPEVHKNGGLHWHGIFSGHIPTRWWKDNCAECGLGYMAKSVKLESASQASNYCIKYISKHVGQTIDIERFRRINYSRSFPANERPAHDGAWEILQASESIEALINHAWRLGKDVTINRRLIEEIIYE